MELKLTMDPRWRGRPSMEDVIRSCLSIILAAARKTKKLPVLIGY